MYVRHAIVAYISYDHNRVYIDAAQLRTSQNDFGRYRNVRVFVADVGSVAEFSRCSRYSRRSEEGGEGAS